MFSISNPTTRNTVIGKLAILTLALILGQTVTAGTSTYTWPENSFSNATVERTPTSLVLRMDVNPAAFRLKSSQQAWLRPAVVTPTDTLWFSPVVVSGRLRYNLNIRYRELPEGQVQLRAGQPDTYHYQAIVPYQPWMDHCDLVLTGTVTGCCGDRLGSMSPDQPLVSCDFREKTLAPIYIYESPAAEMVKIRMAKGEAYVDFPVSKSVILPDYRNNSAELGKIRATIDEVRGDSDVSITSITFTGYASPEGSYESNERLARNRTEALIAYVRNLYAFPSDIMHASWVAEDWAGLEARLRDMDIADRDALLAIVTDTVLTPDQREWRLKKNYPQQYATLLADVYPSLRHSDYVITYNIRNYTKVEEIAAIMATAPQKLSLAELFLYANSLDKSSPEFKEVMEVAVRMYPSDPVANLNAATTAIGNGDYDRARAYLQKAGDTPRVAYISGVLEARQGNYAEAVPLLNRAADAGITEAADLLRQMREFDLISH